ncbi:hypothetical protein C2G38_2198339 [Gigaspora rosea]|uniref:Uncharacterized protein n=1 Tax=Gigaspora rosea TaxID=44941 RepID=A0A397UWZ8_9GLOM|nr:hypothetical protein C2G38_2198339 [Gigaspora rosea]
MNEENYALNNSEKNIIKTEDPNSFLRNLGNLGNLKNLSYLKTLVENYKLSDKQLIEALELLSDPSLFKVYNKNTIVRLELHLRICKAILEVVTYSSITLEYDLRDKFNNGLNNFAEIYYETIKHEPENTHTNFKNYNINFLLINLRDISRSTKLNNTFDIKVTLDKVLQNNYSTKKFLKKEETTKFDQANSYNQILYELLSLNYSLNFTNNTIYKVLQYYKEDYLFEFIWKYTYLSIQHNLETKFDISKILNDQEEFIEILNGKGLAAPPNTLLFGILDFAQNLCKKTTHVVTLVYSYFLGIEALQKSNCTYIWFKSVELLLFLSSKEPGLFQEIVQNKINNFKPLNNSQEFKDILQYVTRKLELEDEFLKNLNLTKNEKIFIQKFTTEKSIKLLTEIVIDRLSCPVTRKITGDFFILLCGHSISHQFKIQNFKCPFCNADIESDSIYNLSQNAILRSLCKFIEQDGYVYSADTNSYMKIFENIPRGPKSSKKAYSKGMLFAFEKADIAEKQLEYPIAIMWFTRVLHFYPKSYSVQCRRAIAFLNLKMYLKAINDLTTAIKLKPSKSCAYIHRSKIYIIYKNFDNALHDIEEALKIDPYNKDACSEKEKICEYKKQTGNIDRPISNFMQLGLSNEILINIFKFVKFPLNLILTCKSWYNISCDHMVRAEWIVYQYGRAHALFHAIRLGPKFINLSVVKAIITNDAIISSYFIQRLLLHFGQLDQQLELLKMEHNANNQNISNVRQQNPRTPWASDLDISVFIYLLEEADNQFKPIELSKKGNDMELFHFLSAGPHVINDAREILDKNKDQIKQLILEKRFIPFPPRPKHLQAQTNTTIEEYPAKDGFENNRQLNIIARAILICKDLVTYWKAIGYHGICKDVNDLVMQGAVLILYPPTPPEDWTRPSTKDVSDRLEELIEIGFELSYTIIGDIMQLFEQRLPAIGNTLIEAFIQARNDTKENLLSKCLIEALKPNRKLKGTEVFEFLYRAIDGDKESKFSETMEFLLKNKPNNNTLDNNNDPFNPLEFSIMYYNWCLKRFGENAKITENCFEDILNTRISIDNYYKQNQNNQVPAGLMQEKFKNECEVFKIYCNARNFFKPSHLPIICQAIHDDILKTLFEYYLAILFDIQTLHTLQPIENLDLNVKLSVSTIEKKSLFRNETYKDEWSNELEKLYDEVNSGSLKGTNEFREYLKRFWEEYIKKL